MIINPGIKVDDKYKPYTDGMEKKVFIMVHMFVVCTSVCMYAYVCACVYMCVVCTCVYVHVQTIHMLVINLCATCQPILPCK